MSIVSYTFGVVGQNGVSPRRVQLITTDGLSAVLSTGYLNPYLNQIYTTDIIDVIYSFNTSTNTGIHSEFLPIFSSGNITLTQYIPASAVTFPVTSGNLPQFNGTSGNISDSTIASSTVATYGGSPTASHIAAFSGNSPSQIFDCNIDYHNVIQSHGTSAANNVPIYYDTANHISDSGIAYTSLAILGASLLPGSILTSDTNGKLINAGFTVASFQTVSTTISTTSAALSVVGLKSTDKVQVTQISGSPVAIVAQVSTDGISLYFNSAPGASTQFNILAYRTVP